MSSNWSKCSFAVPVAFAETFAWLLAQSLDHPIETLDGTTMSKWIDTEKTTVVASFDGSPPEALETHVSTICSQLSIDPVSIHTESVNDDSWKEGWKAFFEPQLIDETLCIYPPWKDRPDTPYAIEIEPGMAFGTGTHETTKMMLSMMLKHLCPYPSAEILDVGAGSGILSIAAEKFGHRSLGIELDPVAVENAWVNVHRNDCKFVQLRAGTIETSDTSRPWVLVNILAKIIMSIHVDIQRVSGDHLLLSGFLLSQRAELLDHFPMFKIVDEIELGPWGCVYLRRIRS
jgi:ribosomal protein L11 methyltransferase